MIKKVSVLSIFVFSFINLLISPCFGEKNSTVLNVENYLNSIKTLKAELIQISANGEVETGQVLIKKPGQMRFEYNPPSNHLVMTSGLLLVIIDKKSSGEPQRYLTSQTPIGYLLNKRIDLINNSALKAAYVKSNTTYIILADDSKPKSGQIELVFSQQPMKLKEWTITNYSGEETRTLLERVIINENLDNEIFNIGSAISKVRKELALQ